MQRRVRMKRELEMIKISPPFGITCWQVDNSIEHLEAQIIGIKGTPYADGVFKLDIKVPERYPFEPLKVTFLTAIYHPNIDTAGRICLDILKMPPAGNWKPSLNISTVLTSIQLLMNEPNPDDPLMTDISEEFKYNHVLFVKKAEEWTRSHATQQSLSAATYDQEKENRVAVYVDDSDDESEESSDEESQRVDNNKCEKRDLLQKRPCSEGSDTAPCKQLKL